MKKSCKYGEYGSFEHLFFFLSFFFFFFLLVFVVVVVVVVVVVCLFVCLGGLFLFCVCLFVF